MGMFDDITEVPPQKCRECGAKLGRWQSKDGPCQLLELPFWKVNQFYTSCDKCGVWHQFDRVVDPPPVPLSDYQLRIGADDERGELKVVSDPES
jgi:hypothetical protein